MTSMKFHEKLRKSLKAQRYSQEAIAELLDVSQGLVSGWCRGVYVPDIYQAKQLSQILGLSLDYLLDDAQGFPPQPVNKAEIEAAQLVRTHGLTVDEVILLLTRRKLPRYGEGEEVKVQDVPNPHTPSKPSSSIRNRKSG